MVKGIRSIYPSGLNERFGSKFRVGSRVWSEKPEEGRGTHRLKWCEYNNEDKEISLNTLTDKNYQASSKKFRQIKHYILFSHQSTKDTLWMISCSAKYIFYFRIIMIK